MDGTKEPDLRRKKIIHRVIERIDRRIEILISIRNRLVELEQRDQGSWEPPTPRPATPRDHGSA